MKLRLFAIRGLTSFPSNGMKTVVSLANKIPHVSATVEDHGVFAFENVTHGTNLTAACVAAHKSGRGIVLWGHSFGANAACMIAENLARQDIPVELLVGVDPAQQSNCTVPKNVKFALGYYQMVDPAGRGVLRGPGMYFDKGAKRYSTVQAGGETVDSWLRRSLVIRKDVLHVKIDDDPRIIDEGLTRVAELSRA